MGALSARSQEISFPTSYVCNSALQEDKRHTSCAGSAWSQKYYKYNDLRGLCIFSTRIKKIDPLDLKGIKKRLTGVKIEDQKRLIEVYQQKVLNQETSLLEFSRKETSLKSLPSKVSLKMGSYASWEKMPLELFEKIANSLFSSCYFVDLQAFPDVYLPEEIREILKILKKYPLINFHILSSFTHQDKKLWTDILEISPMIGFYIEEYAQESSPQLPRDRVLSPDNRDFIRKFSRLIKEKGFFYFIVNLREKSVFHIKEIMEFAIEAGVSEIQFKTMLIRTLRQDEVKMSSHELDAFLVEKLSLCVELAIENKIRLTIDDQNLISQIGRKKVVQAMKFQNTPFVPPFPLEGALNPEFSTQHNWNSLNKRVSEKSSVAQYGKCFKPFHHIVIDEKARVGPCNFLLDPDIFHLEDFDGREIEELWNSKRIKEFRESLLNSNPSDKRCMWCFKNRFFE